MAPLASLMVLSFALQCIDPAGSETQCTATVDKEVCAWPFDYWQQSDAVRRSRTDTMITVSLIIDTDRLSTDCGKLQLENLKVNFDGQSRLFNSYGNITELTENRNGTRHKVSFKINAEDVVKHMKNRQEEDYFGFIYKPKYSKDNCSPYNQCWLPNYVNQFIPFIYLMFDNAPVIVIDRVEQNSDSSGNSSVPSSVLRNLTQVAVWKENSLGTLVLNVHVSDDNVYKLNPNPFEYSAITSLNVTFSVLVQFCSTLDSHQQETVADADALSVERPLGTRSASCQQLAWCAQVNSTEVPNRALMQYRWNVTELYSAVQELYEQLDLSNRSFALVFVTMEVSATSGTANPLHSSKQVVWAVWLPQRLRATVVGKSSEKEYEITTSAAKANVKAEMPTLIVVVLCVLRAVYEQ